MKMFAHIVASVCEHEKSSIAALSSAVAQDRAQDGVAGEITEDERLLTTRDISKGIVGSVVWIGCGLGGKKSREGR